MKYKLRFPDGKGLYGSGFMPIPCGSLFNSWCPLKKNKTYVYAALFQLVSQNITWSLFGGEIPTYLTIEMFGRNGTMPMKQPLFRLTVLIKFKFCRLHIFC